MIFNRVKSGLIITTTILVTACGGNKGTDSTPVPPTPIYLPKSSEIVHISPELAILNKDQLELTYQLAKLDIDFKSMIVIKDQGLAAEAYFNGTQNDTLVQLRSITKTVTAMLIGIAIDQGLLLGVDQTIGEFLLPEYPQLSDEKAQITLRHLLTMTSGFEWDESDGQKYLDWANSTDPVGYLLDKPLADTPGTRFNYNSAAVHLLMVILDRVTQGKADEFAAVNLAQPLGITNFRWETLGDGRLNGSAGIELRPIDTAKLALMLLHSGQYQGVQVVPEAWVEQAKSMQVSFPELTQYGEINFSGYGYLWWQGEGFGKHIDLAWGWGGQFIAAVPEHDLLVITHSRSDVMSDQAILQEKSNLSLIISGILPALDP